MLHELRSALRTLRSRDAAYTGGVVDFRGDRALGTTFPAAEKSADSLGALETQAEEEGGVVSVM